MGPLGYRQRAFGFQRGDEIGQNHAGRLPAGCQRHLVTKRRAIAIGFTLAIGAAVSLLVATPSGPASMREFDPDRLASLETRMWQAYYAKEKIRLFGLLVTMLREQYHYSWATATREGFHLARAAATFGDARGGYEQVLPDLEAAYGMARDRLGAGFDARAVARAELAWWVARRTPGEDSAGRVGELIADEYALLYEAPRSDLEPAAMLRAQAGALRDAQAAQPDWDTIGRLLRDSYRSLRAALSPKRLA